MAAITEQDCFYCVYVGLALEADVLGKPSLGSRFSATTNPLCKLGGFVCAQK